jgi:predicted GIY-YIG superfamily endonuclease
MHLNLFLCVLAASAVVSLAEPAKAIDVSVSELDPLGFHDTNVPQSSCNYMYLSGGNHTLMYYGESTNCAKRFYQHENKVTAFRDTVNKYQVILKSYVSDSQLNQIASDISTQMKGIDGDYCMAGVSINADYKPYYIDLKNAQFTALSIEQCVLRKAKGMCNVAGSGSTRGTWVTLKNAIIGCQKDPNS